MSYQIAESQALLEYKTALEIISRCPKCLVKLKNRLNDSNNNKKRSKLSDLEDQTTEMAGFDLNCY